MSFVCLKLYRYDCIFDIKSAIILGGQIHLFDQRKAIAAPMKNLAAGRSQFNCSKFNAIALYF
ncbi:MAG: hypothetical protein SNJ81_07110 [Cyanobacteriota bacterium]